MDMRRILHQSQFCRLVALVVGLFCMGLSAQADNEIYYGVYQGTGSLSGFGTKKAETYDVALRLTDPSLVGLEIRGLRIPVNAKAKNAGEYKGWLTKELTLTSGKMTPDIVCLDATPNGSWAEVRLDEPYVIEETGLYIGYSFTVSGVDTSDDSDANKTPLMRVDTENPEGLLIHTSRTYRKWTPLADEGSPAVLAILGGEAVKSYAATLQVPQDLYTLSGKPLTATLTLVNHGAQSISNLDYEIEVNGQVESKHVTKSLPGGYFGRSTTMQVTIPAPAEGGTYDVAFRLTKVNGEDNQDAQAEVVAPVTWVKELPVRKPLVEEYTGTWCQYCPRVLGGMEKMSDKNGDMFVGVAYHVSDEMSFATQIYYPANPSGLPSCFIDRAKEFTPQSGQSVWESRCKLIAPASIEVSAHWADEAKTRIEAVSTTTFIRNFNNNPYHVAYILLANDLHSADWAQMNALAGGSLTGDSYIDKYIKSPNPIYDLHYNEVALAQSATYGAPLAGSLPSDVHEFTPYDHTYTFDISNCQLPLNKEKLEVVVVLINAETGEVMNANKGHVTLADGIEGVRSSEFGEMVNGKLSNGICLYDLMGRRIAKPTRGLYIQDGKKIIK